MTEKPTLNYQPPEKNALVWGYLACGVPAAVCVLAIGGAIIQDRRGYESDKINTFLVTCLSIGCGLGLCLSAIGLWRDRRKRQYAYIGLLLNLIFLLLFFL